ncbi:MAG TPA: hypothetical protein VFG69_10395 [Nannocystaceae bacterium]|nr:hypothetical protein [Nannocystaceae bacterium]
MTLPASYSTEYADHRRASRVAAMPGRYAYAERLVAPDRYPLPPAPHAVLVGAHGACWALCYPDRMLVVDATGTRELAAPYGQWIGALEDDGSVRLGNRLWSERDGSRLFLRPLGRFSEPGIQLVARWHDELWTTVVQSTGAFKPREIAVHVRSNGARIDDETAPRWAFAQPVDGTAAIADDGTVLVATADRHLHVLTRPRDLRAREPEIVARVELPHEPYAVSAVENGFVVLSAIESAPPDPAASIGRRFGRGERRFAASWRTEVRVLDGRGTTQSICDVGFAVLQPAVEVDRDRFVLAGRGLACVAGGKLAWTKPGNVDVYATAFGDGTLAVGLGSRIAVLDREGAALQTMDVPDRARVVTPLAIGPDGSLAFGTTGSTHVVPVSHG